MQFCPSFQPIQFGYSGAWHCCHSEPSLMWIALTRKYLCNSRNSSWPAHLVTLVCAVLSPRDTAESQCFREYLAFLWYHDEWAQCPQRKVMALLENTGSLVLRVLQVIVPHYLQVIVPHYFRIAVPCQLFLKWLYSRGIVGSLVIQPYNAVPVVTLCIQIHTW